MERCCKISPKQFITKLIICRPSSPSCSLSSKSHYDTLGITPNCNIADVKKAYYNLSMVYHPDKNDGSAEALERFREITKAYEVLSNISSKKLYDRGVLHSSSPLEKKPKTYPKKKIYVPQEAGRTPIYDFDQWSRQHYGDSILRRSSAKQRYNTEMVSKDNETTNSNIFILLSCVMSILLVAVALSEISSSGLDKPSNKSKDVVKN